MVWHILVVSILIFNISNVLSQRNGCVFQLICGETSENVSAIVEGLPGPRGLRGSTGPLGLMGPQGLQGPPGRRGFIERPPSFFAEIQQSWTVSDSFNVPDVSKYFSENTGIFTVAKSGLYQFFLTISISSIKVLNE